MSRRHKAEKREVNPDPKFGEIVITKFMNAVMKEGKKSAAERIVYGAFERMETKSKSNPVQLFHQALDNVMPAVEVRSRRVGGATYQVPVEVRPERRQALAIRWLITAARARNENTMVDLLLARPRRPHAPAEYHRYARPRRLHDRGRAFAARARRCCVRPRFKPGCRAADRDRLAPGR